LEFRASFELRISNFELSVTDCRLIIDPAGEGAWNMALDEALLESAQADGVATLRFYQWNEPTLSLGYFQPHADRRLHPASSACPLVRRASGGGAILHDREITYSVALPSGHPLAIRAQRLYDVVHGSLIETLARLGVLAQLYSPPDASAAQPPTAQASKPFLCFQRREHGDVVLGQFKIAGSAQRRQRGAVLQHGSVLWSRSQFAPELPGVINLADCRLKMQELLDLWPPQLASALGFHSTFDELSDEVRARAQAIERQKFSSAEWTQRR
jgi:lipoyl(octanoyl) transferase